MSSGDASMADNRRRGARARLLLRGRVVLNGGFTSIDCVVLDLSAGGAKLKFPSTIGLPDTFELRIGTQPPRRAQVRHRGSDSLGVEFVED